MAKTATIEKHGGNIRINSLMYNAGVMTPEISYIICTSPRSGSTLLSTGLQQTGIAGRPSEYFNPSLRDYIINSKKLGIISDDEYLEKSIAASTTPNGVFGTKLHAFQTRFLMAKIEQRQSGHYSSLHEAIESAFPGVRYIFLRREHDKVKQAVSYYRALLTNEWWRYQMTHPPARAAAVEYYELGIRKCLEHIEESDTYWEQFFLTHKLSPLRLTFEETIGDYAGTIRRTLSFLGLPTDTPIGQPVTVKISDERSLAWEKRFLESNTSSDTSASLPSFKIGAPF